MRNMHCTLNFLIEESIKPSFFVLESKKEKVCTMVLRAEGQEDMEGGTAYPLKNTPNKNIRCIKRKIK